MADDPIAFAVEDGLARITLNRPQAGNTLTAEFAKGLMQAAVRCHSDPAVRAVLLTANGGNFCFGGDLRTFHGQGDRLAAYIKETTAYLHSGCAALARMDAPLVMAVQGAAAGAGFSLALLGDLVYVGESTVFAMAYTAAGLSPDGGSTFWLPRVVGLRRAQELTLTNRRLSGREAVDWGIATACVADEALQATAEDAARRLAAGPTRAYGRARRLLMQSFEVPFETQMELEGTAIAASAVEPDGRQGIEAFLNKRTPAFTGRA